jgi:hypothetical protein
MSNYHILDAGLDDESVNVVFHIPIPDENTQKSSYSLRTAVTQKYPFTATEVPWGITTGAGSETEKLQNGELYEHKETVKYDAKLSAVAKQTIVDNRYTKLTAAMPAKLHKIFIAWGIDRDVP